MSFQELSLEGLKLISPSVFKDERGYLFEIFRQKEGTPHFAQDNCSCSKKGVIRGMHYQRRPGQAKLVSVLYGEIYDVAVDLRPSSPTFGKWEGVTLDALSHKQLYIPEHFAHGFCVLSDWAVVVYKLSTPYDPEEEKGFRFDDPQVGIEWPTENPILSERDKAAPSFEEALR